MEQVIVTIDNRNNTKLFVDFIKGLYFIKNIKYKIADDRKSLPVIWAKNADVTALFGASGKNKLNLTEIRKSWQRKK